MKYKEVIKIKNKIQTLFQEKKIKEIDEILQNYTLKEKIELLKLSNISISLQTKNLEFKKLMEILKKNNPDKKEEIQQFQSSNQIYNNVTKEIENEGFSVRGIEKITIKNAILLISHIHFIFSEYCKETTENFASIRETIISYFNHAIHPFLGLQTRRNLQKRSDKISLENKILDFLYSRLEDYSAYEVVIQFLEMYQYGFVDFKQKDKLIQMNFPKNNEMLSRSVAIKDYQTKQDVNNMTLTNEFDELSKLEDCICQDEYVYRQKMKNFFFTENLKIKMGEFSIEEWIRIFIIITKINQEYRDKNHYSILIKSKKQWIDIFKSYHFSTEKAEKILAEMTLKKEDKDIRENPIVRFGDNYTTIPSIICTTDIYETLISIFHNHNNQVNFKGTFFEEQIRKEFQEAGIKNSNCKVNQKECDMCFEFDNCLFICELKNEFQPLTNQQWYRFYKKEEEHKEQLKKIYEFYSENLQYIREKLKKKKDWEPKRIYQMLLYSNYLGKTEVEENRIVSNWKNVINFFIQAPISFNLLKDKKIFIFNHDEERKEKLGIEDFLAYMKMPVSIQWQKERLKECTQYIGITDQYLMEVKGYEYCPLNLEEFLTKGKK